MSGHKYKTGRVVEIDVGQTFPAAADADNLAFVFSAAIHHTLYDHVQTRDVATAGENSDAFVCHDRVPRVKRSTYPAPSAITMKPSRSSP